MSSDWEIKTLNDICDKITDGAHNSPKSVVNGKPMASVKDLTRFGIDLSEARLIAHDEFDKLVKQGCRPEVGDVLIAKDGNSALDTVCNVKNPLDVVLLSSVAILRPNTNLIDSDYLKYYFSSNTTIEYLKSNFISGAAIPRVVLKDFKKAKIKLPSLRTQKKIASILNSLEERIENLSETNATLEAIAQVLFKSWFVDFDPVRAKAEGRQPEGIDAEAAVLFPDSFEETELGLVPKGWKVSSLGETTSYLSRGISPKYTEQGGVIVINQKCIRDNAVDLTKARRHDTKQRKIDGRELLIGDVLVNSTGVGTLGRVAQILSVDESLIVDSHVTVVRAGASLTWNYLGLALLKRQSEIEKLGEGSTGQTELSRAMLAKLKIIIPNADVLYAFDLATLSLREKFDNNLKQAKTVALLRDTLLPRLISGQLRLPEIEERIEDAAT